MDAKCTWHVSADNVDNGLMIASIRENVADKGERERWADAYINARSPLDDHDPDLGFIVAMEVSSLAELETVLKFFRNARAEGISVNCGIQTPSIVAFASLGDDSRDARMHQKPRDQGVVRQIVEDIQSNLGKLKEHVMTIGETK